MLKSIISSINSLNLNCLKLDLKKKEVNKKGLKSKMFKRYVIFSVIYRENMISLVQEQFNDLIASKIIGFMEHPTAKMMKEHVEYGEALRFDPRNDWSEWQTLYGFSHIGRHDRHYLTYGGGPEGGVMKIWADGWYVWERKWGTRATYLRILDELEIIYIHDDGHEAIKLVRLNITMN